MPYPSYSPYGHQGWQGSQSNLAENPDDPGAASPQYWAMWERWQSVQDVVAGTLSMRACAEKYLPRLCNEADDCWQTRINRSVLTPLFDRVIKASVGLILRKPIIFDGGDEDYWKEWRTDVDRAGSTVDEFVGKILFSAIAYGHCGFITDYPSNDARTLREEREIAAKPYFIQQEAPNILGWRHDPADNQGMLQQVRFREFITEADGRFGNTINRQIRVMEPGKFEVWKESEFGSNSYSQDKTGTISVSEIPLSVIYSQRQNVLLSRPPLESLAHLNIQHYQLQASLINSLHVAAFPLLMLQGWDDTNNELQNLSVGNALAMPPEGGASYVEPSANAFDSLQAQLEELSNQISTLGLTILARPKASAESGEKAAIDRADSNSMLAQISINAEQALQQAMNWAGEYAGVEPPKVSIDRDFNAGELEGPEIAQFISLYNSNILDKESVLRLLVRGEVLQDDVDIDEILSATENEELESVEKELDKMERVAEIAPDEPDEPGEPDAFE
jgi:hypothetical protein